MTIGTHMITAERNRQVREEGYTAEHDAGHSPSMLPAAAYSYLEEVLFPMGVSDDLLPPSEWPWRSEDWKPDEDRLVNLVKAGALVAAAIDAEVTRRERA